VICVEWSGPDSNRQPLACKDGHENPQMSQNKVFQALTKLTRQHLATNTTPFYTSIAKQLQNEMDRMARLLCNPDLI